MTIPRPSGVRGAGASGEGDLHCLAQRNANKLTFLSLVYLKPGVGSKCRIQVVTPFSFLFVYFLFSSAKATPRPAYLIA
jgi:hypothetical protein